MKKLLLLLLLLPVQVSTWACPACEKQQPELLKGITHGTGPEGRWDYIIMVFMTLVVLFTLYFSIKWLIRPGEKSSEHIKRTVLNFD